MRKHHSFAIFFFFFFKSHCLIEIYSGGPGLIFDSTSYSCAEGTGSSSNYLKCLILCSFMTLVEGAKAIPAKRAVCLCRVVAALFRYSWSKRGGCSSPAGSLCMQPCRGSCSSWTRAVACPQTCAFDACLCTRGSNASCSRWQSAPPG